MAEKEGYQPMQDNNAATGAPKPVETAQVYTGAVPAATAPVAFAAVATSGVSRSDIGWYDRMPRRCICAFCGAEVITKTRMETGTGTHLVAGGLCVIGCVSYPCVSSMYSAHISWRYA